MSIMTLEELGQAALDAVSDLYDDDQLAEIEQMCDLDKLRWQYMHSDCDNFAYAMQVLTGWDLISVSSPAKGPLHRLVRTPAEDGARLVDVQGYLSEAGLCRRYKTRQLDLSTVSGLLGCTVDGDDEALLPVMQAITYLPEAPFQEPEIAAKARDWIRAHQSNEPRETP